MSPAYSARGYLYKYGTWQEEIRNGRVGQRLLDAYESEEFKNAARDFAIAAVEDDAMLMALIQAAV